ncbi:PAS domain-containing protein [Sulfuricurvum sp.]|uniref:PAS domain-containing protein n=1 Tax=Sulfuricurvum sp. TaxID=2025608 RepID=UPI002E2ED7A4|nr:PAS domain-containing protein [Sulfuricurvum sp.]HEX5329965.1 PAS domain-containing protein [Sulfuricurvum sp.]
MGNQIKIEPHVLIVSRTNKRGIIEYANRDFCTVSGYSMEELMDRSHSIVRHPDMPGVIFKLMWERLHNNQDIFAVVKNLTKNGDYYWVTTHFEIRKHPYENRVVGYVAHRRGADAHLVTKITPLYEELLAIEKAEGLAASEAYFNDYLKAKKMTYDEFIEKTALKEGLLTSMFKKLIGSH